MQKNVLIPPFFQAGDVMMVKVNNTLFYARIGFFPIFKLVEKGNLNGIGQKAMLPLLTGFLYHDPQFHRRTSP
jgi:hypothetical protein